MSNTEKFKEGQFSLTPAEEEVIRARAKQQGEDPEVMLEAARRKMATATGRLREEQSDEAVAKLEKEFGRKMPDKKM